MVKAYPIDNKGEKSGKTRMFSDTQWNKMVTMFGKRIHWRQTDIEESAIKEVELIGTHVPVSTKQKRKYNKTKNQNTNENE